jgi:hypothetical protein
MLTVKVEPFEGIIIYRVIDYFKLTVQPWRALVALEIEGQLRE